MQCLPFHTLWHCRKKQLKKIDPGTKQPNGGETLAKEEIPQRIEAAFPSAHQGSMALHGMVCPWIIQRLLNRGNGFKTNVAQYHVRCCYCTVQSNSHPYLSLSSDLPKGMCFHFTIPRASPCAHAQHCGRRPSDTFRGPSCLCWYVTGKMVSARFIFSQPSDAAQMMFKHPAPRV